MASWHKSFAERFFTVYRHAMTQALHTSTLTSLPLLARGKVRDNYAVGQDRLLMVASDRPRAPRRPTYFTASVM